MHTKFSWKLLFHSKTCMPVLYAISLYYTALSVKKCCISHPLSCGQIETVILRTWQCGHCSGYPDLAADVHEGVENDGKDEIEN
jgi:hypothetical protein